MINKKHRSYPLRRNPGRPKRSEQKGQVDTESLILHHAGLLFMKSGYAGVSMSAITNEVGITKPTLYHYFPDKEHLYTAVLCDCLARIGKEIVTVIDGVGTVREKLFGLAYGFFRFAPMSMSSLMRDVDSKLDSTLIKKVYASYDRWIIDPHEMLFLKGMKQGELEDDHNQVRLRVDMWLGLLDALSQRRTYVGKDHEKLVELTQTVVTQFMDGIVKK
ncbi:TetR/AcrR family transcriptional regulator [Hazenella coriacea]|uniref:TetR family transcriptional regulator n=1 Tax=Hazenella coriacea TaxID=1179467 RepID=A0A4R3LBQ5_9BACL|nr:TetR/AcrR family transcriptional regulator [Hazenella coriacea]TCS96655.1 TetR family transcriptional regulator [Hazenella coriacea]